MAIVAATENETIAWKIQRILEENEFEWSERDWESVRHEMIESLVPNWRNHEDVYYALNHMWFANTPGEYGEDFDDEAVDYDDEDY